MRADGCAGPTDRGVPGDADQGPVEDADGPVPDYPGSERSVPSKVRPLFG